MLKDMVNKTQLPMTVAAYCCSVPLLFLLLLPVSYGQMPELANPTTLSGSATSARFLAGASINNGGNFLNAVASSAAVDITAEIHVEQEHVGTIGNLYMFIVSGQDTYLRNSTGTYLLWDGSINTLLPSIEAKQLEEIEPLVVVDGLVFASVGLSGINLEFYFAYDTQASPGELFFNGLPLSVTILNDVPASQTLFAESVSSAVVQATCIACHTNTGIAAASALNLLNSDSDGFQLSNYNTLIDYIQNAPNGSERIALKPQGLDSHGGGVVLAASSSELQLWISFVDSAKADIAASDGGPTSTASAIFNSVSLQSDVSTLRKASLLFAGKLPDEEALAMASSGLDSDLRRAIRSTMNGEGFSKFLLESANDRLLTEAFNGSLFSVVDRKYYPNSTVYFSNPTLRQRSRIISAAVAEEPLRLIEYVVTQEKPYSEILTADYTMMNPYSAEIYNSELTFSDPDNYDEWVPAQITDYYRCDDCNRLDPDNIYDIPTVYPHAGVLNSPAFLSRYPSTETNRNRARARWAYYYFLGVDIEGISERTTDEAALQDENNPTLNNPNCIVCHDIMDPVAGAFQNYSDDGFYRNRPGGLDSLPFSYKRNRQNGYQTGDTWYSDMLQPGFGNALAPNAENSLQWLAQEFVQDSRFGDGTVNFWYPAVMGREPYTAPGNPEDSNYSSTLAAFNAEQEMIGDVAAKFLSDQGNGVHNLKDLLVELAMSVQFRALAVAEVSMGQEFELAEIGAGRLLTPEQLNRKVLSVMGFDWRYGNTNALEEVYNLIYGGIDSVGITDRATDLTTLMSAVVTTLANEASCSITNNDFSKPIAQRLLFPMVELSNELQESEADIRENIQYLHHRLLGEDLAIDSVEVSATYSLFEEVLLSRLSSDKGPAVSSTSELCILENVANPISNDSNQTLRSWAAVINYLMRDYHFIHE